MLAWAVGAFRDDLEQALDAAKAGALSDEFAVAWSSITHFMYPPGDDDSGYKYGESDDGESDDGLGAVEAAGLTMVGFEEIDEQVLASLSAEHLGEHGRYVLAEITRFHEYLKHI